MMKVRSALFLVIVALTAAAGCASATSRTALDGGQGNGLASPALMAPDCRNQGAYNRAANLCVSNGP
jgi:hypothetical protein